MEDGFRYIVDSWDAVYKIGVRPLCARPNHAARAARLIAERLIVSPVSAASSANIVQRRLHFYVERTCSEAARFIGHKTWMSRMGSVLGGVAR
jgi:hypothetical protein